MPVIFRRKAVPVPDTPVQSAALEAPAATTETAETVLQALNKLSSSGTKHDLLLVHRSGKHAYRVCQAIVEDAGVRVELVSESSGLHLQCVVGAREDAQYDPVWR